MVLKVRGKLKNQKLIAQNTAGDIPDEAFQSQEYYEEIANLQSLKRIFMGKNQDLFSFILHHQFRNEVPVEMRIKLFCRLASLFEAEFVFPEETGKFENLEYAMIYPGIAVEQHFTETE